MGDHRHPRVSHLLHQRFRPRHRRTQWWMGEDIHLGIEGLPDAFNVCRMREHQFASATSLIHRSACDVCRDALSRVVALGCGKEKFGGRRYLRRNFHAEHATPHRPSSAAVAYRAAPGESARDRPASRAAERAVGPRSGFSVPSHRPFSTLSRRAMVLSRSEAISNTVV